MRHRKHGYKLGRTSSHRLAMLRNMAASLFEHGQITTTIPKAKALQPFVEKIITRAKMGGEHSRRRVESMIGGEKRAFAWSHIPRNASDSEREAVEELRGRAEQFFDLPPADEVERNRYGEIRRAPKLTRHIFENVAPRFEDRSGGYTRIVKLGYRRLGDAAELCVIQFVGAEEGPEIGGRPSTRRRQADRRTAYAAKVRKAREAANAPAEEKPAEDVEATPATEAEGKAEEHKAGENKAGENKAENQKDS